MTVEPGSELTIEVLLLKQNKYVSGPSYLATVVYRPRVFIGGSVTYLRDVKRGLGPGH